jgi:hypothetical protein
MRKIFAFLMAFVIFPAVVFGAYYQVTRTAQPLLIERYYIGIEQEINHGQ